MNKGTGTLVTLGIIAVIVLLLGQRAIKTVDAGFVGVAVRFGEVQEPGYPPGMHFVDPVLVWADFDVRQSTIKYNVNVPTRDQMQVQMEVSVQYRIIGDMAPEIFRDTGDVSRVLEIHLQPKLLSAIREEGKSIDEAQAFFNKETVMEFQSRLMVQMREYMLPKGLEIQDILIRDITLPKSITDAINLKKAEQEEAKRAEATLDLRRTEAKAIVEEAAAEKTASLLEADRKRIEADAEAYKIDAITTAIAGNPSYLQLQAIEALKNISKSSAQKVYFLDSDSPQPLPLMHMGEQ